MADIDQIRTAIHDYVVSNFMFGTADVDDDASLIGEGVLDSMAVLEMVLFVEEQLGVAVSDSEVLPAHFDSVNALASFVVSKRPGLSVVPVATPKRTVA
jgi:acyl carrier protein